MKPGRVGRIARTVRHIPLRQAVAHARHALLGGGEGVQLDGPAPSLAADPARLVPFLPAPDHAHFDGWRSVTLLGRKVVFGDPVDWEHAGEGPLWAFHLHQFDYLRLPALRPQARTRWLLDWIERHPSGTSGTGWKPHPISLRILTWGKLLLTPGALELDGEAAARVRHSLACQVETLNRNLEVRLAANHLLSNLVGVVFGALLLDGVHSERWLQRESALRRELETQIGADGGHQERSPMYHALLLENLLDLLNLTAAAPGHASPELVAELTATARRMLVALRVWTHPDGEIALFADSAFGIAHAPAKLEAYAAALGVVPDDASDGVLRDVGYVRLAHGPYTLIASVAGPSPAHQPGHAHCDALAFELSLGNRRVVTDTGVCEYIPGPLRAHARSTRAHATAEIAGADQAELWSSHRVGGRPRVALEEVVAGSRAQASCASWSSRDTLHRRHFALGEQGLEIRDVIEGRRRPVRFSLPLAPGLEVSLEGGTRARVALPQEARELRIELPQGAHWRVERAAYFPRFGHRIERPCLVGEAADFASGVWRFALDDSR